MSAIGLVTEYKAEIDELCNRYGVVRLRLFGSALNDRWDPNRSDLDFLVEYGPKYKELPPLQALVGLKGAFEDLFDRRVDVVNMAFARSKRFIENALANSLVIFGA